MKKEIMKTDNMLDITQLSKIKGSSKMIIRQDSHDCITISRQSNRRGFRVSFSNEILRALNMPQYVDCYWYEDSFVMVASESGHMVALTSGCLIRDQKECTNRFHLRSRYVFKIFESKWNLSKAIGYLYSGGKFVKSNLNGKPAVVISRTETDYYRSDKESDGE